MTRKEILMYVRASGYLKGLKPAVIYLKPNAGKIYNGKYKVFVMSIKNNILYFQSLSRFLKKLDFKYDFEIKLDDVIRYQFITSNRTFNALVLFLKERKFLDVYFDKGLRDTFVTEDNISRTIDVIKNKGIKELVMKEDNNEESDSEGKGSN